MELAAFLQVGRNPCKLISDLRFFWVGMVKIGCAKSGHRTQKLNVFRK